MRLIRLVADLIDSGESLGIIKNDFSSEIVVPPNSSLALLNCSMNIANAELIVDGANNQITFQFTDATGIRTAILTTGGFAADAHDTFMKENMVRTLNNALGRLLSHDNTPTGGVDSTGGGFSEDIGKQWTFSDAGGKLTLKWANSSRTTAVADWQKDTTMVTVPAAPPANYNIATFVNTATAPTPSSFRSATPYTAGCGQFFCRLKAFQGDTGGTTDPTDPKSGFLIGLALSHTKDGGIGVSGISHGLVAFQGSGDAIPLIYPISGGAVAASTSATGKFLGGEPLYWVASGSSGNSNLAVNRNFGHLQYLQYADPYFKYLIDGGIPRFSWDDAMVGFRLSADLVIRKATTAAVTKPYEIYNITTSAILSAGATVVWDLSTQNATLNTFTAANAAESTGTLIYTSSGGGFRWIWTRTEGGSTVTFTSPEACYDTATQNKRAVAGQLIVGTITSKVAYGTLKPWSAPNEADFKLTQVACATLWEAIKALGSNPYNATYPGTADGTYPNETNNTAVGGVVEVKIFNDVPISTIDTLYPVISIISDNTTPAAPSQNGYVMLDNVRGTLDPWIQPAIRRYSSPDHGDLVTPSPPAPPPNRATTRNFIQMGNEIGDYIGFYNRSQRAGTYRSPAADYFTFLPMVSVKLPGTATKGPYEYVGTRAIVSSNLFQNLQLLWNSKPLHGYDGATAAPKSLLATIPTVINKQGGFQYEARNVNRISFRNTESFSLRNAEIQILSGDGNPVAFNGLQTFTLAIID